MRVPVSYTAKDIVNWTVAEEYAPGKWRPARCCGFGSIFSHVGMRLRITWRVFTGQLDALNWEATSGEPKSNQRRYKDCTDPEFFTAAKVHEPKKFGYHDACSSYHIEGECPGGGAPPS